MYHICVSYIQPLFSLSLLGSFSVDFCYDPYSIHGNKNFTKGLRRVTAKDAQRVRGLSVGKWWCDSCRKRVGDSVTIASSCKFLANLVFVVVFLSIIYFKNFSSPQHVVSKLQKSPLSQLKMCRIYQVNSTFKLYRTSDVALADYECN